MDHNLHTSFNRVCVIGLGYIGLPTAALIASKGIKVLGVDILPNVVDQINKGKPTFNEIGLDTLLKKVVKNGTLSAHLTPLSAEVFLVTVPTPFKKDNQSIPQADIRYLIEAIQSISKFIKRNDLVIIESTSPVGTTDFLRNKLVELSGLDQMILKLHTVQREYYLGK